MGDMEVIHNQIEDLRAVFISIDDVTVYIPTHTIHHLVLRGKVHIDMMLPRGFGREGDTEA